jgi:hypothetical protein
MKAAAVEDELIISLTAARAVKMPAPNVFSAGYKNHRA